MRKAKKIIRYARFFLRDMQNMAKYGRNAPLTAQLIHINPQNVEYVYYRDLWNDELPESLKQKDRHSAPALGGRRASGLVIGGDWDKDIEVLEKFPKYMICQNRFSNGDSWEDTGAYSLMDKIMKDRPGADGCHTSEDVMQRYRLIDELYLSVQMNGRLKSRKEIQGGNFREQGGVYFHIGRNGDVLFGGGGWHRLVVARFTGMESIPAQLGVVHSDAIRIWRRYLHNT